MVRLTFAVAMAVTLVNIAPAQPYNAATMSPYRSMPPLPGATPGNILYPGGTPMLHPTRLGGTISGAIPYTGAPYPGVQPGRHGGGMGRSRTMVVPYAVPVFSGGYYDPGYGYGMPQAQPNVTVLMPQQQTPAVIINQYGPDGGRTVTTADATDRGGLKVYEATPAPKPAEKPAAEASNRSYVLDDKPNIYLIALKDNTVRQAIGYWAEGALLKYVTPHAKITSVPLDMVDRNASAKLNAQNKLELDLPPADQ